MKKCELEIIKDVYEEYKETKDHYMNICKNSSIHSDEYLRAIRCLNSTAHDMGVIRDLLDRIGIDITNL